MANYITISRMVLIFPVLILATAEPGLNNWIALILFVIAGITDHLDGYIARKTGSTSELGALLDLIADKLLIIVTLFYFISYESNLFLIVPSIIIIIREIAISSFRQFLAEKGGKNPIKVTFIAKSKTTIKDANECITYLSNLVAMEIHSRHTIISGNRGVSVSPVLVCLDSGIHQ